MAIAPIDRLTLRIQELHAAEAAVDRLAEKELQLTWRLIELRAGRRVGSLEIGMRPGNTRQQRDKQPHRRQRRRAQNTAPHPLVPRCLINSLPGRGAVWLKVSA